MHFDGFYCSPLKRALESAAIISDRLDLDPYVYPLFAETGFSWGEPNDNTDEIRSICPRAILDESVTDHGWAPADSETGQEAYERAQNLMNWLLARHKEADAKVLVITHGSFGAILIGYLVGLPPSGQTRFSQNNACISRVDIVDGNGKLRFLNSTCHLPTEMLT